MNRISTLLVCWLLCLVGTLQAQRIYVKAGSNGNGSSWAQASGNLHSVLQSATSGTEIWVAEGSYYPTTCTNCTSTDRNLYFELKDNVKLYGGFNGTETMLSQRDWLAHPCVLSGDIDLDASQANNSYTVLYSHNVSASTIIDGFYIQQGNAEDMSVTFGAPGNSGGGWYNDGSQSGTVSNPTVNNCTFRWNTAIGFGGGVYNDGCFGGEGNPTLTNCTFEQNSSPQGGGGMYNNGSFSGICNPTYMDCHFISNTTTNSGAGMFNNGLSGNSSPDVHTTTFFDNRADFYGGGVYNLGKEGLSSPTITNCLFNANRGSAAGGIYNLGAEGGNSSPIVTNSTFYGNVASVGACIYNQANDITGTCAGIVTNCIFYGNDATSGFGYVFQNGYASPTISFCLVQVNDCTALSTGINSTVNCGSGLIFNQNPLFEDPANSNFRIASGSPVIDQGDNGAINTAGGTVDLDNNNRLINGIVDYGAYEYQGGQYTAPTIIDQPEGKTVCEGTMTQLTFSVIGSRPLLYQWQKNGIDINGETDSLLTFNSTATTDAGDYQCRVISTMQDTAWTQVATLAINPRLPVSVSITSSGSEACDGQEVIFEALAVNGGMQPIYQWTVNGSIVGIDSSRLSIDTLESSDLVNCYLISSETCISGNPAVSNSLSITVSPSVSASVSVSASTNNICQGETVSFDATATNGGSNPGFQWQINGQNVGSNNAQYSSTGLNNGDIVSCQLTSSAACVNDALVTSNNLTMVVNPILTPAIAITSSGNSICEGSMVTFNAVATNGGNNPDFQWRINGQNVGTNSTQYSNTGLNDGDVVSCMLTSSAVCLTSSSVASNSLTITVSSSLVPSVEITTSTDNICQGAVADFNAMAINGGSNPGFQWQINGQNAGPNSAQFSTTSLNDGDQVSCILTSSESCVTNSTATSNTRTISVQNLLQPMVMISPMAPSICESERLDFSLTAANEGATPFYQWQVNGLDVGTNSAQFSSTDLADGDQVQCLLTSSEVCVTSRTVSSNTETTEVFEQLSPELTISSNQTDICEGMMVRFNSSAVNGGTLPEYQWTINGQPTGDDSASFETNQLQDGDKVSCQLTSSEVCVDQATVSSNEIAMKVSANLMVGLAISADKDSACQDDIVRFSAAPSNEGDSPQYQWQINDLSVGDNAPDFSTDQLNDGDRIRCTLTSSATCVIRDTITSTALSVSILPPLEPSIFITSLDTASEACLGDTLSFVANTSNQGSSPIYQWFVNGNEVANDGPEFSTDLLSDGDEISCVMISSAPCLIKPSESSNTLTAKMKDCTLSTSSPLLSTGFSLFPNPATDHFVLRFDESLTDVRGRLMDVRGKTYSVFNAPVTLLGARMTIQTTALPAGIYWIQIEAKEGFAARKVIVVE